MGEGESLWGQYAKYGILVYPNIVAQPDPLIGRLRRQQNSIAIISDHVQNKQGDLFFFVDAPSILWDLEVHLTAQMPSSDALSGSRVLGHNLPINK